jgi:hypothetical protein
MSKEKSPGWAVLNRVKKRQSKKKNKKSTADVCANLMATAKNKLKDRENALRRNELYRQEWQRAFDDYLSTLPPTQAQEPGILRREPFLYSSQAQELALRWEINFAPHPDDVSLWGHPDTLFKDQGWAVDIVRHGNAVVCPNGTVDLTPHLEDKRYLTLKIDLWKPKIQATKEISYLLDGYLTLIGKKKTRGPALDELPWRVWDMHHKEMMSLLAITRRLFPEVEDQNPNTDPSVKKRYEQVREAYNKAKELIEKVIPT